VEKGSKSAQYTKENAQLHWGVTPPGHWALFDVKKDPGCQNDLAKSSPEQAKKMAAAYDAWWDETYPVMVERGGDREIVWSKYFTKKTPTQAPTNNQPKQNNP
jgi:hypothetical protein